MSKQPKVPKPQLYPSEIYQSGKPSPAQRPVRPRSLKGHPDIRSTKEYKQAARRWTSIMVGLPIIMYTSWVLYERGKFKSLIVPFNQIADNINLVYGNKSVKEIARPSLPDRSSNSS
ncbi:hypothetical protein N7495_006848 [Penicillium taxi]|uniref:uncharacterized protein n=1 Tax=Penicillium taxi TaxID=168475 RepID=UPI0025452C56|nr:uncharacterized protein N7495_006848 [Penicillium taxi]KAJ5895157.1 hypothetical protein N7495_006848 [Penicillium taxi]